MAISDSPGGEPFVCKVKDCDEISGRHTVSSKNHDLLDGFWYTENFEIRLLGEVQIRLPSLEDIHAGRVWGENLVGFSVGIRKSKRGRFSIARVVSFDKRNDRHIVMGYYPQW